METHAPEVDVALQLALNQRLSKSRPPQQIEHDREQAEQFRQEMLAKYGVRDLAVRLIREVRDAE